jgi:hypothetical protein
MFRLPEADEWGIMPTGNKGGPCRIAPSFITVASHMIADGVKASAGRDAVERYFKDVMHVSCS